jgi:DnaK suppressor protein
VEAGAATDVQFRPRYLVNLRREERTKVDPDRARALLTEERKRVESLLAQTATDEESDIEASKETGDIADPAERLTAEEGDDAVVEGLRNRLEAIERAEGRLRDGTYGYSVLTGLPIPDERLEADPAAELTVEEATADGS